MDRLTRKNCGDSRRLVRSSSSHELVVRFAFCGDFDLFLISGQQEMKFFVLTTVGIALLLTTVSGIDQLFFDGPVCAGDPIKNVTFCFVPETPTTSTRRSSKNFKQS